ncbi:MAG: efflux RND transporter periplasmic adaptor subunit [Candidatus Nitrospinota bacterium M3_3B_026]
MKAKLLALVILAVTMAAAGTFVYLKTPEKLRRKDALHYWLHDPAISKTMKWIGLSEETVLAGQKIYWCPMHPQVRRDEPGLCPICNMRLVEMKEEGKEKADGALVLTTGQIQQAGVRFAVVKRQALAREVETTGRVDADERLLKTISAWAPGRSRIERLYVNFTGQAVKQGQPLLAIYNPGLVATQEEYLALLENGAVRLAPLADAARTRLARWGVSEGEMELIRRNGKPSEILTIYSPLSGVVIKRLASEGDYVTEGQPILKLTDLSRVWIYGDVYEHELPFVKTGMTADVAIQGRTIKGNVGFIDPVVNTETRTARVRFDVSNKDGSLKPGMFASVRIHVPGDEVLAVPESAVILTGKRAVAFVHEGGGRLRPVKVELGKKWLYPEGQAKKGEAALLEDGGRYHEVLSGLSEGQKIVASAGFLVAAEARFQGALENMSPKEEKEPAP